MGSGDGVRLHESPPFGYCTAGQKTLLAPPVCPKHPKAYFALNIYVQKLIHFTSHLSRNSLIFVLKNNMSWIRTAASAQEMGSRLSCVLKSDS